MSLKEKFNQNYRLSGLRHKKTNLQDLKEFYNHMPCRPYNYPAATSPYHIRDRTS